MFYSQGADRGTKDSGASQHHPQGQKDLPSTGRRQAWYGGPVSPLRGCSVWANRKPVCRRRAWQRIQGRAGLGSPVCSRPGLVGRECLCFRPESFLSSSVPSGLVSQGGSGKWSLPRGVCWWQGWSCSYSVCVALGCSLAHSESPLHRGPTALSHPWSQRQHWGLKVTQGHSRP